MKNTKRGITLIALVITIIVLLMLAGITVNFIIGENGIINRAKIASEKYENAAENEQGELAKIENTITQYVNGSRQITLTEEELNAKISRAVENALKIKNVPVTFENALVTTYGFQNKSLADLKKQGNFVIGYVRLFVSTSADFAKKDLLKIGTIPEEYGPKGQIICVGYDGCSDKNAILIVNPNGDLNIRTFNTMGKGTWIAFNIAYSLE